VAEDVVVLGCGEQVERDVPPGEAREPAGLMEGAAREAAADAGIAPGALAQLEAVVAVEVLGWRYPSAADALAVRLGAAGARRIDTCVGGNTPQSAVHELARRIRAGRLDFALVAGGEAIRSRRRARKEGVALHWSPDGPPPEPPPERLGDARAGSNAFEERHGLALPPHVYPLFENALQARRGLDAETHRQRIARLWSRFSAVASENPHAWFPKRRTPEEIAEATAENRMIAWPYTKYMNAVIEVNQGAAVLLASASKARELGVPEDRRVYYWGGAEAVEEPWFVSERPRFDASPAQAAAIRGALAEAGVTADALGAFDLYSCFPVAVELACEALGVAEDDPRPLTTTGGLAFGGGPGNAYSLHGIAGIVRHVRARGTPGLATALGWFLTKHAAGVYGPGPRPGPPQPAPVRVHEAGPEVDEAPSGTGTVETWTVIHDREGAPARGLVLGRTDAGRRFLANPPPDRAVLEAMEAREMVGSRGRLATNADGRVRFDPS
jgi:acetyl-CoA C-acetyltransferase